MSDYTPPDGFEICEFEDPRPRPMYESYHEEVRAFKESGVRAISKSFDNGCDCTREMQRYRDVLRRFGRKPGFSQLGGRDLEGILLTRNGNTIYIVNELAPEAHVCGEDYCEL